MNDTSSEDSNTPARCLRCLSDTRLLHMCLTCELIACYKCYTNTELHPTHRALA